jgi:hypothetical protein
MRSGEAGAGAPSSEMLIVDTFTRLIFAEVDDYSPGELQVIEALREVEPDLATDDLLGMGEYLRALGVAEMIELVSRVQYRVAEGPLPARLLQEAAGTPGERPPQQRG